MNSWICNAPFHLRMAVEGGLGELYCEMAKSSVQEDVTTEVGFLILLAGSEKPYGAIDLLTSGGDKKETD